MSRYTICYQYDSGPAEAHEVECSGDQAAADRARARLQQTIDETPALHSAEASVGEGGLADGDPRWIGRWRWAPDDRWSWEREG